MGVVFFSASKSCPPASQHSVPDDHRDNALDAGDAAAFSGIFLASSFSCGAEAPSTPAHQRQYPAKTAASRRAGQAASRWGAIRMLYESSPDCHDF